MKAMILAGGFGKRLRPLTDTTPKPLLKVGGKPIIEWQMLWMKRYGFDSFIFTVSYLPEAISEFLGDGSRWGVDVEIVVEKEPLGTGGALRNIRKLLEGETEFVVTNGDVLTNLDLGAMRLANRVATIALTPLPSPYGVINVDGDRIVNFIEKPLLKDHWINAGVYKMTPKVFDYLPENGGMEDTAFPRLASEGLLGGTRFPDCYWRSTDSLKDLEEANKDISTKEVFKEA